MAVKNWAILTLVMVLTGCGGSSDSGDTEAAPTTPAIDDPTLIALGKSLFSDKNLSFNRQQSCASCHNPGSAFIDSRKNAGDKVVAVSTGADGVSLGDRNAPTAMYAAFSPAFKNGSRARFNTKLDNYSGYLGGQFHDGRAATLAAQAGGPPLNPLEMGMPDKASVVDRLRENADYVAAFEFLYGSDVFNDTDAAYTAMTEAIQAFEFSDTFYPFDSAYDRSLTGAYTYEPGSKAATGKALFFSETDTNCSACHMRLSQGRSGELFTGFEYHNIGVPENTAVRSRNGVNQPDLGLGGALGESAQNGKFKVPTLRNVAVTGPYMHNGIFQDLKTVVLFYDHFNNPANAINPETGVAWAAPEVNANISFTELNTGDQMTQADAEAIVCFLRTLTDARYEHLLPDDGLCD